MQSLEKSQLQGHLTELASGGEGVVYLIGNRPGDVYKEYKQIVRGQLNIAALRNLVGMLDQMAPQDRQHVMSRTAWPHTLVNTGAMTHGFLMEKVAPTYMRTYGLKTHQKSVLCEWTYLIYQSRALPANMASNIPIIDMPQKVNLIKDLAATMEILHRYGIVVGDMSGRNLLWASKPEQVFIIDCDSFRVDGQPGTTEVKESPHFMDPHRAKDQPTDHSSDVFKLGTAAFRAIWQDAQGEPSAEEIKRTAPEGVPRGLVELIVASRGAKPRPTVSEWVAGLNDMFKFGGRPVLKPKDTTGQMVRPGPQAATHSVPPPPPPPAAPRERPRLPLQ